MKRRRVIRAATLVLLLGAAGLVTAILVADAGSRQTLCVVLATVVAALSLGVLLAILQWRNQFTRLKHDHAALAAIEARRRLFLAKANHELRTPVTAIRGEAEVALRSAGSPEDLREALAQIGQTSQFLQRRLDDLMVLASAENGGLEIERGIIDGIVIARHAAATTRAYANANGVSIDRSGLQGPATGSMQLVGDADRIEQALVALIDNAIKFSPRGGTVHVAATGANGTLIVKVTDEGPGVAPAELARIFDPHVQGHAGRALGGSGLGLSVARWIAEAHGGTIMAGNVLGHDGEAEGFWVALHLPIAG